MSAVTGATPAEPLAESLLADARRLLADDALVGGSGSRAAALLARSALEEAIWSLFPQLREVRSSRATLLTFAAVVPDPGRTAGMAWGRLTAACHHHAYELPPTAEELDHMLDTVHDVIAAIRSRQEEVAARRRAGTTAATGG